MAKEETTAVSIPAFPYRKQASTFSSSRFLGLTDHPNPTPSPSNEYELDEGDVVWSPDLYSDQFSAGIDPPTTTVPSVGDSLPGSPSGRQGRFFWPDKIGLSAALEEDRRPLMHPRCTAINMPIGKSVPAEVSKVFRQSAPVNVPAWRGGRRLSSAAMMEVQDDGEDGAEEKLPPHVIVARSQVTTFSVFEGAGRTLKGRDLRRVRNTVFQKTGFLD